MSQNTVCIPALSASIFNENDMESMTQRYLKDNQPSLSLGSQLLSTIAGFDPEEDSPVTLLTSMTDDFDDDEVRAFYGNSNVIEFLLGALKKGTPLQDMSELLLKQYPIFNVIDEDECVMDERIDRATENQYGELYPLYSKPDNTTIRLFLDHDINVAFMEIGEGNYFAYLTSCGQLMSDEIAFAYYENDGCVPPNIADDNIDLSNSKTFVKEGLRAYFGI